jgi:hypothetical protein
MRMPGLVFAQDYTDCVSASRGKASIRDQSDHQLPPSPLIQQ